MKGKEQVPRTNGIESHRGKPKRIMTDIFILFGDKKKIFFRVTDTIFIIDSVYSIRKCKCCQKSGRADVCW